MKNNPSPTKLKTVMHNLFTKWKEALKKSQDLARKFFPLFWRFFKFLLKFVSKALAGAVIFAFMAELAPGLREKLPNFYEFIDLVLEALEVIVKKAIEGFQSF